MKFLKIFLKSLLGMLLIVVVLGIIIGSTVLVAMNVHPLAGLAVFVFNLALAIAILETYF